MLDPKRLELHVHLEAGRERDCAEYLRGQVRGPQWKILAGLAAEIVAIHETELGSLVVVATVEGGQQERQLADLGRAGLPLALPARRE
jgi:hypothetical protein